MTKDRTRKLTVIHASLFTALFLAMLILAGCTTPPPPVARTEAPLAGTNSPVAQITRSPTLRAERTPTNTPGLDPEPVASLEVEADRLRGVEIRFWHPWQGEASRVLQDLTVAFNEQNEWGIRVETFAQDGFDALSAQIQQTTDGLPNIAAAYLYQALGWDQGLVELRPYLEDPQWGLGETAQNDFFPAFWGLAIPGETLWGLPAQRSGSLLVYNETWAKELGFEAPPDTQAEFQEQACTAAQALRRDADPNNDGRGGWFVSTDYAAVLGWMYASGAEPVATGADSYRFDSPEIQEAFSFLRGMYDFGCAWQADGLSPEVEFAGRRSLFVSTSLTSLPYQVQALQQAGNRDTWTVLAYPSAGGEIARSAEPAISVYGPSYFIFESTEEEQLAAWLWLKWLLEPENHARFAAASASFPLRQAEREALNAYAAEHPQWAAALELLPYAHREPELASWRLVRWAVFDASTQLFRYYFTIEQVPNLVKLLDKTAADLDAGDLGIPPTAPATATNAAMPASGTTTPVATVSVTPTSVP